MDRVADDVVRATVAVVRLNAVAPVSIHDAVRDQCLGVAATDLDPTPAPGRSVAEDAEPLEVNGLVAVHPTGAGVTRGSADHGRAGPGGAVGVGAAESCSRKPAHAVGPRVGGPTAGRRRIRTVAGARAAALLVHRQPVHAAESSRRIGLDHDAVALAQPTRIVSAVDENLLEVCSGLDQDGLAGLHGVHRRLDGQMARRVTAAARIGGIDVPDGLLLHGTTVRRQNEGQQGDDHRRRPPAGGKKTPARIDERRVRERKERHFPEVPEEVHRRSRPRREAGDGPAQCRE